MRYVFAKEKLTIKVTLEPGALVLHFTPDEQALAHVIMEMLAKVFTDSEVERVAELLRTEHTKEEEN